MQTPSRACTIDCSSLTNAHLASPAAASRGAVLVLALLQARRWRALSTCLVRSQLWLAGALPDEHVLQLWPRLRFVAVLRTTIPTSSAAAFAFTFADLDRFRVRGELQPAAAVARARGLSDGHGDHIRHRVCCVRWSVFQRAAASHRRSAAQLDRAGALRDAHEPSARLQHLHARLRRA